MYINIGEFTITTDCNYLKDSFKLRHNIYCKKLKYIEENPEIEEKDIYDDWCLHIHILQDNTLIGTVRVIDRLSILPMEEFESHIDNYYKWKIRNYQASEISRLCVSDKIQNVKNSIRVSTLLSYASVSYGYIKNVMMYSIMEERLLRQIRLTNKGDDILPIKIGQEFNFNGKRCAYMIDPIYFFNNLKPERQSVFKQLIDLFN